MSDNTELYGYITNNEPDKGEAIAVDMFTPTLETALGVRGLIGGVKVYNSMKPFLGDIWAGRNLLFHKPFKFMNKEEFKNYGKLGEKYYQNFLQKNPVNIEGYGEVKFPNSNLGKDYTYNMEQYPFLRKNLKSAKWWKNTNRKNEVDRTYDHFKNTYKNKLYDYLIEDIKNVGKRYKMIEKFKDE